MYFFCIFWQLWNEKLPCSLFHGGYACEETGILCR
jgi:hypothetical protein